MGTEILRPQDCLTERIRCNPAMCSRRRNYGYSNNSNNSNYSSNYNNNRPHNRRPVVRHEKPDQRRQQRAQSEPSMPSRTSASDESKAVRRSSCDDSLMEKVTILRRGESLDSKIKTGNGAGATSLKKEGDRLVVNGTVRVGPAPEMMPKIRIVDFKTPLAGKTDVYAGSAFAVSPAPSSLPLPSFSKKKQISVDDSATRDIKRLLRLEL